MSGETEREASGWTVDTVHVFLQRQLDDMRKMLDERYATQTKAVDAAFIAQQTAMRTALEAAEKAVATAMTAAEKAVTKAESAAEKRFEATNEFRGQLADQAATFMPRTEADAAQQRLQDQVNELKDRLNRSDGSDAGIRLSAGVLGGTIAALASLAVFAGVVISLIVK